MSLVLISIQVNHRDLLRIGQENGPLRHPWPEHLKGLSSVPTSQPPHKMGAKSGV